MNTISPSSPPPPAWWTCARFGLFIHWGVYSVPAGVHRWRRVAGASEWLMHAAKIPVAEYKEFASALDAANFDADSWVRAAREAGMGYIVIGAKHHDGFALFDSQVNDWNAVRGSAARRDLLRPLVEACRRADMPLGFYYSQGQDWVNGGAVFGGPWDPAQLRDFDDYLDQVAIPQIRELLTIYGPEVPALLWWDTPAEMTPARADRIAAAVEELRPGLLQNDRLGTQTGGGHFDTPEQRIPANRPARAWETCMTTNNSWGFNLHDQDWKSPALLIRQLAEVVSQGGNYLLNVGPRPDGTIPEPSLAALQEIGKWMQINGCAIGATKAGPFPHRLDWGFATQRDNHVYLLVEQWPGDGRLSIPLLNLPAQARLIADPEAKLHCEAAESGAFTLLLPREAPDHPVSVVELVYDQEPRLGNMPVRPRPPIIPQPADGSIHLRAADAEIVGDHLALIAGAIPELGCWTSLDSWPLWRCLIHQGGTYRVAVEYAVPEHREGTLAEAEIGDQTLSMVVSGTGGWGEFRTVELGNVQLSAHPELTIRLVAKNIPVGAVMNLRSVFLTPIEAKTLPDAQHL
jgi:alpha-L-fucosidase